MKPRLGVLTFAALISIAVGAAVYEFWFVIAPTPMDWVTATSQALVVFVSFGAAAMLLTRRWHDPRARLVAVLSTMNGVQALGDPNSDAGFSLVQALFDRPAGPGSWMLVALVLIAAAAIPAMLLHLALIFPKPAPFTSRVPLWTLYAWPATAVLGMLLIMAPGAATSAVIVAFAMTAAVFIGYPLAVPMVMYRQYARATFEEKRQIRWPALGIIVAVAIGIVIPTISSWSIKWGMPTGQNEIEWGFGADPRAFVLIPLTFLIAIFKYRLLDIDVIIRKTITYSIVTITLLVTYAAGVAAASRVLASRGVTNENMRLIATAVLAALFVPVRDRVQRRIDARFYRRKHDDIESVHLLDEAIASANDLQSLLPKATATLQQIFVCRAAAILAREPRSSIFSVSSAIGLHDEAIRSAHLEEDSSATRSICNLDLHPEVTSDEEAIRAMRARLLVPVRGHGQLVAIIALGAKMSDEVYDARDERIAVALADRVGAAIENFRFRQLTAAESEWRALDRMSRLILVAIAQQKGPVSIERAIADVRLAANEAMLQTSGERIETALSRLVDIGAVERFADGTVTVKRLSWLDLPDVLRPLEQVARDAGQRVGAYEILDRIGRGGMGEVYRATNVHDGSLAAVKILPPLDGRPDARKRFEREGALVATLSHPNIVRVLERGEHDGRLYIAMELIDGETLAAALDRRDWNTGLAIHVALQVAGALADLHSLGVVHRDVKSSNVMLTRSGRAVLLDFGLARSGDASSLTAEAQIVGSLPYIAPEQLSGGTCDARADVWSFGVVLFECLTGRRPWLASTPSALIAEIIRGVSDWSSLELLAGIAPVTTIVRESLQVDPDLRIRDGSELLRRLTHAAQLTTTAARHVLPVRTAAPEEPTLTSPGRASIVRRR